MRSGDRLVVVAFDRTDTQGVADSVVKYLRRDHGYQVVVVGPGQGRAFEDLTDHERARIYFFLELDAVSGVLYHTKGLDQLKCPKLAWFVDTHKKPHFHAQIASDFDVVFYTMRTWGGLFGDRGQWLPVHYDAEWIGPRSGTVPTFDVGFVGSSPRERTVLLQEIARKHGLSLLLETTTGPREKELTADLYAQCRIVFNQNVANDMNFRVVEALGCKRLLLTDAQWNGQYELFSDRQHLAYYKDGRDLEALVLHYLRNEAERERIAAKGHDLVKAFHTTAQRTQQLVTVAESLVKERERPFSAPEARPSALCALLLAREWGPDDRSARTCRLSEVASALRAEDIVVQVATLAAEPASCRGVSVHAGRPLDGPARTAVATAPLLENVALLDEASALVAASRPDLVLAVGWEDAVTARLLAEREGLSYALVLDEIEAERETGSQSDVTYRAELEKWAVEGARVVVTESEAVRQQVVDRYEKVPERVLVMSWSEGKNERVRQLAGWAAQPAEPRRSASPPVHYDHSYMTRNNYCVRSPEEVKIKAAQARLIARVLKPKRALVAACAAGEILIPLRSLGVDTWGFDFAEGLDAFVYPEVKDRVLRFDVTQVDRFPFERAGGRFDTFVAIDLFEHIEDDRVDRMLDGIAAHFEQLALVISSSPAFEGHVCVKPFAWWQTRLQARDFELLPEPSELLPDEQGVYGLKAFAGTQGDMSEQIVFFRRTKKASPAPEQSKDASAALDRVADAKKIRARRGPRVSIGVVSCNRPDYLRITLASTRASLGAFGTRVEWLAFDNGSAPEVVRELELADLNVVVKSQKNLGLAPALDELYRASTGEYVLGLEDDWKCLAATSEWLELAIAILDEHEDVGVVRLRRIDDGQCGHATRHAPEVALRHHPWSLKPLPPVVETRELNGKRFYVAPSAFANWTNNPVLCRREVRDWIGPMASYLPDPKDHRPRAGHPGLEGAIDERWRKGP
ncbi:MAG TPA: glycosyltransferase, partial [Planctomycetota bacterium]|nr:glycosyltransferase [Planctomycetota bacterium]